MTTLSDSKLGPLRPSFSKRELLATGGAGLTLFALPAIAAPSAPGRGWERHVIGDFILSWSGSALAVTHRGDLDRLLWESAPDGNFLIAESASAQIRAFGTPEGAYEIVDVVSAVFDRASVETIDASSGKAVLKGRLRGDNGAIPYTIVFEALGDQLRFTASAEGAAVNRTRLRSASAPDEAFFGFGEQLTFFNQKGKRLPILVQEHGVGRGAPIITEAVDVLANGGGGNPYITEAPAPHFITSRLRSIFLENAEYSVFDLTDPDSYDAKVWSGRMVGRIVSGATPLDLIESYTTYSGRMRALPDWVHHGAIVSAQGGSPIVSRQLDALSAAKVPLAGLWLQDWVGLRQTSAGQQLWWDWRLDEQHYPDWRAMRDRVAAQGGRMLAYINPFLSNQAGHDRLFQEAVSRGYLVRKADGSPYLIKNTDFFAGLVDLANPDARTWIKSVIKTEMIDKAGVSGWMADFGEALPFDGKLFGGADPAVWHNRYPEEWAAVNREAIEEAGRGDDIVFFNRSGFTRSPGKSTLFWLGDQLQTWDEFDGIKTAVVGLLSGGVSGFSLLHSDTGGYATLSAPLGGKTLPVVARTPELLMRWMELNAFTTVFRTHVGLDPSISAQIDTNKATFGHLKRFAGVYKGLGPYRKRLVAEASAKGHPVVRAMFLLYPDDPATHDLRRQFLLGPDLLVAPVLDKGEDSVRVYFPRGDEWVDLWSGAEVAAQGRWLDRPAPLGRPAVFLRKGAASTDEIVQGLKSAGVL